jgi:hypothetical protein
MPTFRHGRDAYVLIDKYNMTPYFREASRNTAVDLAETSAFGTFDKTFVVGMREGRISLGGMFDGTTAAVDDVLNTVLGQAAAVNVTFAPEGLAIGRKTYICQSEETTYETTASITDVVAVSTEVQATGGIWGAVSLHDLTAETATNNGSSVDNAAASTLGWQAVLHMTTNDRNTGSIVVKVQHSTDNSAWSDLVTFTSIAAGVASTEYQYSATGTVNRYLRAQWTVTGGTTGAYTFNVSCARENT